MNHKRLSKPAVNYIVILNMAIAILKVRKMDDVVKKAVNITKDTKALNKNRKLIKSIQKDLDDICSAGVDLMQQLLPEDMIRVRKGHTVDIIQSIPETTTNPETLALNLLFIIFNDEVDERLDGRLELFTEIDYYKIIVQISEQVGLEKNVSEDMYVLAQELVKKVKG